MIDEKDPEKDLNRSLLKKESYDYDSYIYIYVIHMDVVYFRS